MAYRLAQADFRVCVLERGKKYPPNSFPRAPHRMKKNFWDPSEGLYGMFNVWSFDELGAVVSSGLGGGSLIYANVLIRKDKNWFVREDLDAGGYEYWPITYDELEPHYERVEKMLGAQKYPLDKKPYSETRKTTEFGAAAKRLKLDWKLPNLAITFANEGEEPVPGEPIREEHKNLHGRTRYTCRLVGECDIGCNYGSKNSLDYNYLSEAQRLGAVLSTSCEVRDFKPSDNGGYDVYYVRHEPEQREGQKLDTSTLERHKVHTDRLILAAGSLGSTYLLLKSRKEYPGAFRDLSDRLGTRFCGNGDLATFAQKSRRYKTDGSWEPRLIDPGYGPVITSRVRVRDREDGGERRGFYVEDAGYPEFVNWMSQVFDTPGAFRSWWHAAGLRLLARWLSGAFLWRSAGRRLVDKWLNKNLETDVGAAISSLFGESELSAGLLPMLGMGRDIPNGRMELRGDKLKLDWRVDASQQYFDDVRKTMRQLARELGATYKDPLGRLNRLVTVHPLGGCPMGRNKEEGVVDSYGRVFADQGGFYEGLYVADGSIMPGPVGPNPSLTIAALADRFADGIVQQKRGA